MSEFKIKCPKCGKPIVMRSHPADGMAECANCGNRLAVPKVVEDTPPSDSPAGSDSAPGAAALPLMGGVAPSTQIATLDHETKARIVHGVREFLSDEARWLPEVNEAGAAQYAARMTDGKPESVPANHPEATRFSLFGAVLREFEHRNVATMAAGRKEFLDHELPEAMQDALGEGGQPPLSHAQCLAVLDLLEKRFMAAHKAALSASAALKLQNIRMDDLIRKLELEAPVKGEEVATALYHELAEIRERLEKLEKARRGKAAE